jgi:hypothetical protein
VKALALGALQTFPQRENAAALFAAVGFDLLQPHPHPQTQTQGECRHGLFPVRVPVHFRFSSGILPVLSMT